jgi:hypothetical protein
MKFVILFLTVLLTGCAVPPKFLSNYFDGQDPCQSYGKGKDWTRPNWCWGGNSYLVTKQPIAPGATRYNIIR